MRQRAGPGPIEREDVPPAMVAAIGRALSVDAATRPPSATAFALSLGGSITETQRHGDAQSSRLQISVRLCVSVSP